MPGRMWISGSRFCSRIQKRVKTPWRNQHDPLKVKPWARHRSCGMDTNMGSAMDVRSGAASIPREPIRGFPKAAGLRGFLCPAQQLQLQLDGGEAKRQVGSNRGLAFGTRLRSIRLNPEVTDA